MPRLCSPKPRLLGFLQILERVYRWPQDAHDLCKFWCLRFIQCTHNICVFKVVSTYTLSFCPVLQKCLRNFDKLCQCLECEQHFDKLCTCLPSSLHHACIIVKKMSDAVTGPSLSHAEQHDTCGWILLEDPELAFHLGLSCCSNASNSAEASKASVVCQEKAWQMRFLKNWVAIKIMKDCGNWRN